MTATYDHPRTQIAPAFLQGVTPKRLIAWFIDIGFTALLSAPIVLPLMAIGAVLIVPLFLIPVVWGIVGFIYRWRTIANNSATWGMRIMAINLRDIDNQRLGNGTAFMHTLGSTLAFGVPVVQVISMLATVMTERGQGLIDMVLGTTMQNRAG